MNEYQERQLYLNINGFNKKLPERLHLPSSLEEWLKDQNAKSIKYETKKDDEKAE